MAVQACISAERLAARVGKREVVLIDEVESDSGEVQARSAADAPEIDGIVRLPLEDWDLTPGDLVEVEITGATEHDLDARIP